MLSLSKKVLLDIFAELLERLKGARLLGELVVDSWLYDFIDLLNEDFKYSLSTSEVGVAVIFRKSKFQIKLIARFVANNAVLETWNEATRAETETIILSGTAVECDIVFFADEINDHLIAILSFAANNLALGIAFGDTIQNIFNIIVGNFWFIIVTFEFLVIAELNFWQNISGDNQFGHFAWDEFLNINTWNRYWSNTRTIKQFWNGLAN